MRLHNRFPILLLTLALVAGCETVNLQDVREEARAVLVASTQAAAELQTDIDKLAQDDPVRKALEKRLADFQRAAVKAQEFVDRADAAIAAIEKGEYDRDSIAGLLKDVPYGGLAASVIGIGFGIWQRMKKKQVARALTQVVNSVEAALPIKTEDQKSKMAAVQDTDTKAMVVAIKGG